MSSNETGTNKALKSGQPPSDEELTAFLRQHPDRLSHLLNEHPDLLDDLTPEEIREREGIVDFQRHRIRQLQENLSSQTSYHEALIDTSRTNLKSQQQVHEAILQIVSAASVDALAGYIGRDMPVTLQSDATLLCIEEDTHNQVRLGEPVITVPKGAIAAQFPGGSSALLGTPQEDAALFFGPAASLIESQALIRLALDECYPTAMLAVGDRNGDKFHTGQATHLLRFLGDVLSVRLNQLLAKRWPGLTS